MANISIEPDLRQGPQSDGLPARLAETRQCTIDLAALLGPEDQAVQAHDDASPTKWHLAHTTWFFETFVLSPFLPGYRIFSEDFNFCFNSYYEAQGARLPREKRGLLTRPDCAQIYAYRAHVDEALAELLATRLQDNDELSRRLEIGINHEQQHQELLLTDILSLFAANPLRPAYRNSAAPKFLRETESPAWSRFEAGIILIGHDIGQVGAGFAFDNESPRHQELIRPFRLANRLVTNAEWIEFMRDGGYRAPSLWLADGWTALNREGWAAPLYWEQHGDAHLQMTLMGFRAIDPAAPVCHVSYYEADAFARWAGKRLPTEFEWEAAAASISIQGNMLTASNFRPVPAPHGDGLRQMFGDVWEWTQSAYQPYPGYRVEPGALGEYNGKFMCSQQVLRGASCVTPDTHARATYRNFFYPHQRWQFCGLRLADEA
ncbi:ergothioneine biosynthesis protein EgtB [Methylocapsa palsarum]|nr:ergothioneine biosynthesis protein EgtB [Methylocapsa palsarum]